MIWGPGSGDSGSGGSGGSTAPEPRLMTPNGPGWSLNASPPLTPTLLSPVLTLYQMPPDALADRVIKHGARELEHKEGSPRKGSLAAEAQVGAELLQR